MGEKDSGRATPWPLKGWRVTVPCLVCGGPDPGEPACAMHPSGVLAACRREHSATTRRDAAARPYWVHILDELGGAQLEGRAPGDPLKAGDALRHACEVWALHARATGAPEHDVARVLRALLLATEQGSPADLDAVARWAGDYLRKHAGDPQRALPRVLERDRKGERSHGLDAFRPTLTRLLKTWTASESFKHAPDVAAALAFVSLVELYVPGGLQGRPRAEAVEAVRRELDWMRAGGALDVAAVVRGGFRALGWDEGRVGGLGDRDRQRTARAKAPRKGRT